jgi:hypothetical protein
MPTVIDVDEENLTAGRLSRMQAAMPAPPFAINVQHFHERGLLAFFALEWATGYELVASRVPTECPKNDPTEVGAENPYLLKR